MSTYYKQKYKFFSTNKDSCGSKSLLAYPKPPINSKEHIRGPSFLIIEQYLQNHPQITKISIICKLKPDV